MDGKKHRMLKVWRRDRNTSAILISWRMAACYLVAVMLAAWAVTVLGVFAYVKYRIGFSEVKISQIAGLPFTIDAYRKEKGKFWTKAGMLAAEGNLWGDAVVMLKQGLPRDPENMDARLLLARIYLMAGRQDMAAEVLVEGLAFQSDKDEYLRTVLSLLFSQQADDAIVELTNRLLENAKISGASMQTASGARLYALFNRDRFEEVDKIFESGGVGGVERYFIESRISWELGNRETALSMLRGLRPAETLEAEVYRTYSYYLKELGRNDERRRIAISRLINFPIEPDPYLDLISISWEEKNTVALDSAVSEYLKIFGSNPEALVRLARLAGINGLPDVAWSAVDLFPKGSLRARDAIVFALEAELMAKNYSQANIRSASVLAAYTDLPSWQRYVIQGLQGVASLGLGKTTDGQGILMRILDGGHLPPAAFASMAKHIRRVGDLSLATKFYRRALSIDASQGGALVDLLEIELEAGTLEQSLDLVEKLPDVRKPSPVFMRRLIDQLESDRYLYVPARVSAIDKLQRRLVQMRAVPRS